MVGEDLSEPESKFLISYGEEIAEVMLYNDDAMNGPNDDAPRIADVHAGQVAEKFHHVGVGRPRKFYVLYPWKGDAVLCAGAIMPFHEFADTKRHTDESWFKKLDADHQSSIPNWFRSIISNEGRDEPKSLRDRR